MNFWGHTIDPLGDPLDPAAEYIRPKKHFALLMHPPLEIAGTGSA